MTLNISSLSTNASFTDGIATSLVNEGDVDSRNCQLLGPVGLAVQGALGFAILTSLLVKRARETPKRPWKIWSFDVSKQVIGQAFVHGTNVLISDLIAHHSTRENNPCSVYLLQIIVDTTIGVLFLYLFLRLTTYLLIRLGVKDLVTGQYGNPPSIKPWVRQLLVYLFSIICMKFLVVGLFLVAPRMYKVGRWFLKRLSNNPNAQVIFTVLVVPLIMNIVQFLIIDSLIKGSYASFQLLPDEEAANEDEEQDDAKPGHTKPTQPDSPTASPTAASERARDYGTSRPTTPTE